MTFAFVLTGLLAAAAPLAAQERDRGRGEIPAGHRPPPGMCRIWVDGVPPGQQPAPTDCATAVRNRPANGRVIFGDDYTRRGAARSFGEDGGRDQARQDRFPATLPEMVGAILLERGRRTEDVARWLGGDVYQVRYVDRDRNGVPERVSWLDAEGRTVQVWIDANLDGRADTVEVFESGRKVRTIAP